MTFAHRVIGAAKLDVQTYEEVENDPAATLQAFAVVVLSSVAAGIGSDSGTFAVTRILMALFTWVAWAGLAYLVGVYLLPEPQTNANLGQMLRTIGFASAPGILRIFRVVPVLGWLLPGIITIWLIAAMVVAIRQALDYRSTGRAVVVCLIAWFIAVGLAVVFGAIFFISARSVLL